MSKPMYCCECGEEVHLQAMLTDTRAWKQIEQVKFYHENVQEIRPACDKCVKEFPFKYPEIWSMN